MIGASLQGENGYRSQSSVGRVETKQSAGPAITDDGEGGTVSRTKKVFLGVLGVSVVI
jgi:hypothetical protein